MRKSLITQASGAVGSRNEGSLDLEHTAIIEITSEDKGHPVESAFSPGESHGWRAGESGPQTIRLIFDQPQRINLISLTFEENEIERTQEFVLRWSSDSGKSFRQIVRQQWNFSPPETTREIENYNVKLSHVTVLEINIVPDVGGGDVHASLKSLRLS
jgi:hypothetical protein